MASFSLPSYVDCASITAFVPHRAENASRNDARTVSPNTQLARRDALEIQCRRNLHLISLSSMNTVQKLSVLIWWLVQLPIAMKSWW